MHRVVVQAALESLLIVICTGFHGNHPPPLASKTCPGSYAAGFHLVKKHETEGAVKVIEEDRSKEETEKSLASARPETPRGTRTSAGRRPLRGDREGRGHGRAQLPCRRSQGSAEAAKVSDRAVQAES